MGGWDRAQRRVLIAALSGVFITLFPFLMVVAALPTIAADLGTSRATLAWAVTAPLLLSAVLLPVSGRLGDLYGHRRVFVVGLSVSGTFAVLSALAWDPLSLVAFRTVSQSAGTATIPCAIALVIAAFSQEDRPRALGYWGFAASFAPAMGLLIGGRAVDAFGWRGLFLLQAALVVVVLPLAFTSLKESVRTSGVTFDVVGGLTFMAASGALVFALDRAGNWHWGHPAVIVAFLVVPAALVAFRRAERRAVDPILPPELFRHRDFVSSCACELLFQISTNGGLFLMPFLFAGHYDADVGRIALYLVPMPLGMAMLAPPGGRLAQQLGERTCAVVGSVVLAVAFGVILLADESRVLWLVLVAWFVVGLANGLIRPGVASAAAAALDPAYYGAGMATTRMVSSVGAAAGITLVISLLPVGGSGLALAMCVVASALAAGAAWCLHPTPLPRGAGIELAMATEPLA